jgi:antitoxin component YwqK of YwqJK toxin-antitoxin module
LEINKFASMIKVNIKDLDFMEWAPDSEPRLSYLGKPYNGIAYNMRLDDTLEYEHEYIEGYREGIQKEFYPNGKISSIYHRKWSRFHGEETEWYLNGNIKLKADWQLGHKLYSEEWNEEGLLISVYDIKEHPEKSEILENDKKYFSRADQ